VVGERSARVAELAQQHALARVGMLLAQEFARLGVEGVEFGADLRQARGLLLHLFGVALGHRVLLRVVSQ